MKKIINPWKGFPGYNCFGCSPDNESGVKMTFYEDGEDILSVWHPESRFQGWLNTLHGGIQAVLLDEICCWVILRKMQTTGMTVKMETRYIKAVSTNDDYLILKAKITEHKRNLVIIEASLYNQENELCTKSICTYFTFSQDKAKNEMFFKDCPVEEKDYLYNDIIS